MSDVNDVIELLKQANSANLYDDTWMTNLQEALIDVGFTENLKYCQRNNLGRTDGDIGKNTRQDIVDFLTANPQALAQIHPDLRRHLVDRGWRQKLSQIEGPQQSPTRQQAQQPQIHVGAPSRSMILAQNAERQRNNPYGDQSPNTPYTDAIVAMDNFLAFAEHRYENVINHSSYDIRNGHRSYPNGEGATSYTLGELRYISGSHGHVQMNYLTMRDFCNPEKQLCKSFAQKLNIEPEDVKDIQFTEANQHLIAEVLLEQLGFDDFLNGKISRDKLISRLSNIWSTIPGLNGVGKYNGDQYGNHHTVSLTNTRRQLDQIRDQYIVDNLTQDLCDFGIQIKDYISETNGSEILRDPNLAFIFQSNPEAILSLSSRTLKLLLNSGLKDELQNIVNSNPDIRKALENQAIELAQGKSLEEIAANPELLSKLQANWSLQGTYTANIDGENGPSTRAAYAQHTRTERRIETQRQFEENKQATNNFWRAPWNPTPAPSTNPPIPFIRQQ